MFTCPICEEPMIWGGDHDAETDEGQIVIISNHSCPKCGSYLEFSTFEDRED